MECIVGRFLFQKTFLGAKKSSTCSHRKIFLLNILKILHVYPNYSGWMYIFSGTLPTMQLIYVYTDIYQGPKLLQTAVYI